MQNQASNRQFGTQLGGTQVSFNGIAAPVLYASASQVASVVPYAISGTAAQITVAYQGQTSAAFAAPVAPSAPGIFTSNQSGAGQIAAVNAVDGTFKSAANPVKAGAYITLYATVFGPSYTNEFRFSYSRPEVNLDTTWPGSVSQARTLAQITIANVSAPGLASGNGQLHYGNNFLFQETQTKLSGRHALRYGVEFLQPLPMAEPENAYCKQ